MFFESRRPAIIGFIMVLHVNDLMFGYSALHSALRDMYLACPLGVLICVAQL